MASNTSLNLIDLDPDSLKANLKNYLRENPQFRDYDYEGSDINFLLDLLAVNTYKIAFMQNMLHAEGFLDTAQLRNSILSHAKSLNYLPRSARSAKATVRIQFTATGESAPYIIPKGSPLTAIVKNDSYTFTVPENLTVASANTTYEIETDVYEGFYITENYAFQPGLENQRFRISNKNVDTSSLTVTVFEDGNDVGINYTYTPTLLDLNPTSKVYFLQASENGYYEVRFGDNNTGKRPKVGSTIQLNYRISSGARANGARSFSLDFDPTGTDELSTTPTVATISNAKDGREPEEDESIRLLAPKAFQVQQRAVVAKDYEILLKQAFPEINAVYAYGGEELNPPEYGKVYIATDLFDVDGLPDSKVRQYKAFLNKRKTFGITPVFVLPEYSYLQVSSNIRYSLSQTTKSAETIKTLVKGTIIDYRDDFLDNFNTILRHSKLETAIDQADPSIISSYTEILLYKKIQPKLVVPNDITLDFGFALRDITAAPAVTSHKSGTYHVLTSDPFIYKSELAKLEDDAEGSVIISRIVGDTHTKITEIGTIDYDTGIVHLTNFRIDRYEGDSLRIYVRPKDPDIAASRNTILSIEDSGIKLSVEAIRD